MEYVLDNYVFVPYLSLISVRQGKGIHNIWALGSGFGGKLDESSSTCRFISMVVNRKKPPQELVSMYFKLFSTSKQIFKFVQTTILKGRESGVGPKSSL